MSEETSQYKQMRRWTGALVVSCLISAFFCFYTFWADTDAGLLLALMGVLLSCIIALRLYWFDIFLLSNSPYIFSHRHSEQTLAENLNRFLLASPDLLWRIRYAGREVNSLNDNVMDMHPGKELKNARLTALFPARVARQYLEALIEVQSQGVMKCFEYQLSLRNNKTATFEARIQPFSDTDCIATIRDITALKEKEEALFNQQLFVHQVMESSPFLVFVRDKFGRFLMLNQATQQMLGHDALVHSHLAILENHAFFSTDENEVLEKGHSIRLIDHLLLPNGEKRWFDVTKIPLIRENETYVLVTAIDVTHLKLAEKSLKDNEEGYHRIINALTVPVTIIDGATFTPTLINQAMGNLLQKDTTQLYGVPLFFIDEPLREILRTHIGPERLHHTITLPAVDNIVKHALTFQPIFYQDKQMFLIVLDDPSTHSATVEDASSVEPFSSILH